MSGFIFNFRKQFAARVKSGEKLQTIRKSRKDGRKPAPGDTLYLWTGLRTAYAKRLVTRACIECFHVYMDLESLNMRIVVSNGVRLSHGEADSFARLDGFENSMQMLTWFRDTYKEESFNGFCVRWSTQPLRRKRRPLKSTDRR